MIPLPLVATVLAVLGTCPPPNGRPDEPQEAEDSADHERPASEVPS